MGLGSIYPQALVMLVPQPSNFELPSVDPSPDVNVRLHRWQQAINNMATTIVSPLDSTSSGDEFTPFGTMLVGHNPSQNHSYIHMGSPKDWKSVFFQSPGNTKLL